MNGDASVGATLAALSAQLGAFLALLLVASALHKAWRWRRSRYLLARFAGLPDSLGSVSLGGVIAIELAAAILLFEPAQRALGATGAAVLWVVYLALILRAIRLNRRDMDCGCSFGATAHSLGSFQVVRNLVLIALSGGVAAVTVTAGQAAIESSQLLGAFALLAMYMAIDQVMALQPLRGGATS
jgi:hypothetical protein